MMRLKFETRPSLAPSTAARKAFPADGVVASLDPSQRAALYTRPRCADNGAEEAGMGMFVGGICVVRVSGCLSYI